MQSQSNPDQWPFQRGRENHRPESPLFVRAAGDHSPEKVDASAAAAWQYTSGDETTAATTRTRLQTVRGSSRAGSNVNYCKTRRKDVPNPPSDIAISGHRLEGPCVMLASWGDVFRAMNSTERSPRNTALSLRPGQRFRSVPAARLCRSARRGFL